MPSKLQHLLSTPNGLGGVLLLMSAVLFAADVGGSFVLDADRRAISDGPSVASAPAASLPAVRPPVAHATASQQQLSTTSPRVQVAVAPAAPIVPLDLTAIERAPHRAHAARTASHPTRISHARPHPHALVAKVVHVAKAVHVAKVVHVAKSVHVAKAVHVAKIVRVARVERPAGARQVVTKLAAMPAKHAIAAAVPAVRVASLNDVHRFVMARLRARRAHSSVISSSENAQNGRVYVYLVIRDRRREWFEKDVVIRNGARLALAATLEHTLGQVPSHPTAVVTNLSDI